MTQAIAVDNPKKSSNHRQRQIDPMKFIPNASFNISKPALILSFFLIALGGDSRVRLAINHTGTER